MPKFARPTSYNGRQATQQWTGDARFATIEEAIAGVSTSTIISPATMQVGSLATLSVEGGAPILPVAGNFDFSGAPGSGVTFSSPGAGQIEVSVANTVGGTATTVNAVTADVITIALPVPAATTTFDIIITGHNVTDGQGVGYSIFGTVYTNGAAVASLVGSPDKISNENPGSITADANLIATANTAVVRVLGIAGKTINWNATARYVQVS